MKKVFDWTVGSFFRTIGRTIAFFVMAGLLYYILSYNDISFGIKDLFFEKVNASEIATNSLLPAGVTYYEAFGTARPGTLNEQVINSNYYVGFSQASPITINDNNYRVYFDISNVGNRSGYDYTYFTIYTSLLLYDQDQHFKNYSLRPLVYLGLAPCEIYNYTSKQDTVNQVDQQYQQFNVKCPTGTGGLTFIFNNNLGVYWAGTIRINRTVIYTKGSVNSGTIQQIITEQQNTNDAINNQTQQQQQQHQEMMDSNTTQAESDATSFFGNFTIEDQGGLSAIVTAPLNTIRSLLSSTCTNLVLPLPFVNENLTLPCLSPIYIQHFGAFFTLYQTIILGIIAYRCIMSIFFDIKGFTNPNDDRIEVMDL